MHKEIDSSGNAEEHKHTAPEYVLCLYITGASPNSARAVTNVKKICDEYLSGKYSLEIIDIYQLDVMIKNEQIIALPLLVRKKPLPESRLIGDMSDTRKVLRGLGILKEI